MKEFLPLDIQLSPQERSTLLAEAEKRNLSPDVLAVQLIKDGIAQIQILKDQAALKALERLDKIVSHLPPVDAVELVRTSREELAQRSMFNQ